MKRTGFKRLSYEEVIAKQREQRETRLLVRKSRSIELQPKVRVPKTKEQRVKSLKTKLWDMFSQYIRKSYANQDGMVMTCDGQFKHWKETHCGHLFNNSERSQSLGGNMLWYDERNFAPQSANGNCFNANDSAKVYMMWAVSKYGLETVQQMKLLKNEPRKFTEEELTAKYLYYKNLFATL
jgi:hypothetical protein